MYFMEDEKLARMIAFENDHYKESPVKNYGDKLNTSDIIDSRLEYIDPTPNIHSLFVKFNERFFWNSLGMVEVKWSQKMTTCAGICYYHGRNGLCSISLSAPLLSLRPRKDLVETLLHEMIHAYLFVTQNRKDREDHGPEFHKHMHRINKAAGTKISVYHTFHDEVEYYQKHIWRCNGPCQHKKPFFGLVRRASNRAPGPNDFWWGKHSQECGGTFVKISEPETGKKSRKSKKDSKEPSKGKVSPNKDIRSYFTPVTSGSSSDNTAKTNGTSNVVTFKDLNNDKKKSNGMSGMTANKGSGTFVLTKQKGNEKTEIVKTDKKETKTEKSPPKPPASKQNSSCPANCTCKKCSDEARKVKEKLRNVWADKFSSSSSTTTSNKVTEKVVKENSPKVKKLNCPICGKGFSEHEIERHVDKCIENSSSDENIDSSSRNGVDKKIDDSNLIDCPVCNKKVVQKELKEHLESCLTCSFENEPDEFGNCDNDENDEIECKSVPCPCCMKWLPEEEMDAHVDECLTMVALKNGLLDS